MEGQNKKIMQKFEFTKKNSQKGRNLRMEDDCRSTCTIKSAVNFGISSQKEYEPHHISQQILKKLKKLIGLQKQKEGLMHSLNIIKEGAITALIQKQDTIEQLKSKCESYENSSGQFNLTSLQLQKYSLQVQQLENERNQLQQELQNERNIYLKEIEEKQIQIDELSNQLTQSRKRLKYLEEEGQFISKKLEIIQTENQQLFHELNDSKSLLKKISQENIHEATQDQNRLRIMSSESEEQMVKNYSNFLDFNNAENQILQKLREKVRIQQENHSRQIQQITKFYQTKIWELKTCFENQITKLNHVSYDKEQHLFEDLISEKSYRYEENRYYENQSRNKLDNFEECSTHNLKMDIVQILDGNAHSYTNRYLEDDNMSQFTKNHFNFPRQYQKNQQLEFAQNFNIQQIMQKEESETRQIKDNHQTPTNTWNGMITFGLGLITGGAMISFVTKVLKR